MSIPLTDLILDAERFADMVGIDYVDQDTWASWATQGQEELWTVVSSAFADTWFSTFTFSLTSPNNSFALPSDFRRAKGVDIDAGLPTRRSVRRFNFAERNSAGGRWDKVRRYRILTRTLGWIEPQDRCDGNYTLYYVQGPTKLAAPIPVTDLTPAVDGPLSVLAGTSHTVSPSDYIFAAVPHGGLVGQSLRTSGWTNATNNKAQARITAFNSFSGAITVDPTDLVDETATGSVTGDILLFNQSGGTWSATGFATVQPKAGDILVVTGGLNPGSRPILTASGTSVTTDPTGLVDETFDDTVTVSIQRANTSPTLMPELEPWAEYVAQVMARKALLKEESDISGVDERIAQMREDIMTAVETDEGEADTIADVETRNGRGFWGE